MGGCRQLKARGRTNRQRIGERRNPSEHSVRRRRGFADSLRPRPSGIFALMSASVAASSRLRYSPTSFDSERLHSLDILRGLALFGMILVHFHQKMRLEVTGLADLIGWV